MSAIRLTFVVQEGVPELARTKIVEMRVPPARHINLIDTEPGIWIETRNTKKDRLYARALDNFVFSSSVEVRTGVGEPDLTPVKSRASQMLHVVLPHDPCSQEFPHFAPRKEGRQSEGHLF